MLGTALPASTGVRNLCAGVIDSDIMGTTDSAQREEYDDEQQ